MLTIIMLLFGSLNVILCGIQSETIVSEIPPCRNPPLCSLSDIHKTELKSVSLLPYPNSKNYQTTFSEQGSKLQRSYYNGLGSTTSSPAYYPAFDPISVLASLAFLAFLLQSFASLFDRSRSILPTIVSGRQSALELKIPEVSTKHVSNILREYENINENWDMNEK